MRKKIILIMFTIVLLILIYPNIEFYNNNYLYMMSYSKNFENSEDFYELEEELCYDESYSYNKKRNISIIKWEYKNFLFFRWFKIKYKKGNICDTEYVLEESYIKHFINNAKIIENENNIDLSKLIENKKAIIKNKRYSLNDNRSYIEYYLDNEFKEMFISINEEGLIIIQVGLSDEGPKFIAYK